MSDNDRVYKCIGCGNIEVIDHNDQRIDGRVCNECGKHSVAIGYAMRKPSGSCYIETMPTKAGSKEQATIGNKTYDIMLSNGSLIQYTGAIFLFNDDEKIAIKKENTIYIKQREVIYIKEVAAK